MALDRKGFSLTEMLVVLMVIAVMLGISLPYVLRSGEASAFDAASDVIAAKLRETQMAAVSSNSERSMVFDLANGIATQPWKSSAMELPKDVSISILSARSNSASGIVAIRFFPDGRSSGGTIRLKRDGAIRDIAVSWLTGAVVISKDVAP